MTYNKLTTQNDLSENPSPRCLCMVVLDTSSSMSGEPIALLNEFFQWLSASMSRVAQSASTTTQVDLPPKDGWAGI